MTCRTRSAPPVEHRHPRADGRLRADPRAVLRSARAYPLPVEPDPREGRAAEKAEASRKERGQPQEVADVTTGSFIADLRRQFLPGGRFRAVLWLGGSL